MKLIVLDSESDDLYRGATKIHVLSWTTNGKDFESTNDYTKMKEVVEDADWFVCHNAVGHDLPLFNKILGTNLSYLKVIDSLTLARYLFPNRTKTHGHSLKKWGEFFGITKVEINDWKNLSYEEYKERCEFDVRINYKLWEHLQKRLKLLYPTAEGRKRIINYLSFKMDCMREQEDIGWKLDVESCKKHLDELEGKRAEKVEALSLVMPQVPKYKTVKPPANPYKKDGSLSVAGQKWLDTLSTEGYPKTHNEPVEVLSHMEPPNPNSPDQLKDWLTSLGWKPSTFKYVKDKTTGKERTIPQIKKHKGLCPSVERLAEDVEEINLLVDLSIISHRIGIFKGFLTHEKDGYIKATTSGFTNTLRFTHASPAVNLPGVDKPWGDWVRGCLVAPDDSQELCGADMSSLEATTKAHYMYPYDPEYASELTQDSFDEHLDLAVKDGKVTSEDYQYYTLEGTEGEARWDQLHKIRKGYKPVNYSCIYGIGPPKLARETGKTEAEAAGLIDTYWGRNWAIKELVKDLEVQEVGGIHWLKNPVNGFWYELRFEKDRFSTLNQGTGSYLFDMWVYQLRKRGIKICGQFHDEVIFSSSDTKTDKQLIQEAIDAVNSSLELNVTLRVEAKFGGNYAEVH